MCKAMCSHSFCPPPPGKDHHVESCLQDRLKAIRSDCPVNRQAFLPASLLSNFMDDLSMLKPAETQG